MRRSSSLAFAAVFALGACSEANDVRGRDQEAVRNASADEREEQSEQRDELMGLAPASTSSAAPSDAEPVVESDADAEQSDAELIAAANGGTVDEARLQSAQVEALGDVSVQIDAERPGVLVGGAIGPEPSDLPRLYIKGPADARVREIVAAAAVEILIVDLQPFSMVDIAERQSLLTATLLELGYDNFGVWTDISREGLMEAMVQRTAGAPDNVDEIFAALPAALRQRTSIQLVDEPVAEDE